MDSSERSGEHSNDSEGNGDNYNNERKDPEMSIPIVTTHNRSDSQARKTSDAQSEVFDTGTKKPGVARLKILMTKRNKRLRWNHSDQNTHGWEQPS